MPRPTVATPAQQSRDAGLARLRRLTWWSAAAAAALTIITSAIAANTIPGRAAGRTEAAGSSNASGGNGTAGGNGGTPSQGSVAPSTQAPQPGNGNGPVAVSGGS